VYFLSAISCCISLAIGLLQISSRVLNDSMLPTLIGNQASQMHKKQSPLLFIVTERNGRSQKLTIVEKCFPRG
jgi:hypothetical protein